MQQLIALQPTDQLHQLRVLLPVRLLHQPHSHELALLIPLQQFLHRICHLGGTRPLRPKPHQFLHRFRHLAGPPSPRLKLHRRPKAWPRPRRPGRRLELLLVSRLAKSPHLCSALSRPPMAAGSALPLRCPSPATAKTHLPNLKPKLYQLLAGRPDPPGRCRTSFCSRTRYAWATSSTQTGP